MKLFARNLFLIPLLLLLLTPMFARDANAQLISWRDVIGTEVSGPDERIEFGEDSLRFGELWIPDNRRRKTAIILIHGGCWLSLYPGVELMHPMADELRNQGFVVWNLEYRRLGHEGGGYPGTFLDIAAGADLLPALLDERAIEVNRILVAGHSAGGHLATWLAARKKIGTESPLYSQYPVGVDAILSLAGINNLEQYARYGSAPCGERTVERLVNLDERGDGAYRDTSPSELLPLGIPHVEITAAFDSPVPPFFGRAYTEAARQAGDDATLILQPEAGHFEMIAPWSSEWAQVLEQFIKLSAFQ
ncbi:MAG: alpha/beta hydrolase [Balneolaceae bacterium]|nr:MAG: alpha/beta hydrolase [Balneolaceae bacterium]